MNRWAQGRTGVIMSNTGCQDSSTLNVSAENLISKSVCSNGHEKEPSEHDSQ